MPSFTEDNSKELFLTEFINSYKSLLSKKIRSIIITNDLKTKKDLTGLYFLRINEIGIEYRFKDNSHLTTLFFNFCSKILLYGNECATNEQMTLFLDGLKNIGYDMQNNKAIAFKESI